MFPQDSFVQAKSGGGGNRTRVRFPQELSTEAEYEFRGGIGGRYDFLYFVSRSPQNNRARDRRHAVVEALKARDGAGCFYCGKTSYDLVLDHVRSRAHGGSDWIDNLVLACDKCNDEKSSWPAWMFVLRETGLLERVRRVRLIALARERVARAQEDLRRLEAGE